MSASANTSRATLPRGSAGAHTASVARALALIEALAGHVVQGLRLKDISDAVRQAPATTLKDLRGLESLGYAERIPGRDDCWRLTARPIQLATHHRGEVARWRSQLDDIDANYSRPWR